MNIFKLLKAVLSTVALVLLSDGYISTFSIFPYLILMVLYLLYEGNNRPLIKVISLIITVTTCLIIYSSFELLYFLLIGSGLYFLYLAILNKLADILK